MVSVKPHNKVAVTQFDNPSAVAFLVAHINYSINVGLGINGGQVHGVSLSAVGLRFVRFIIHTCYKKNLVGATNGMQQKARSSAG